MHWWSLTDNERISLRIAQEASVYEMMKMLIWIVCACAVLQSHTGHISDAAPIQ